MSEKVDLPKKKSAANRPGKLETEDMPLVTSRKRKTGRTAESEPSAHGAGRHAEPTLRGGQGRRSDLVHVQSTAPVPERQRQRHSQTLPAQRRMSMDIHRPRRSNTSNPGSRPVRTRRATSVPPGPPRTMLQRMHSLPEPRARSSPNAWHTVLNSDPLVDSDEECPDEHLRLDYNRRMQVITRLRGRCPTPELEYSQTMPS